MDICHLYIVSVCGEYLICFFAVGWFVFCSAKADLSETRLVSVLSAFDEIFVRGRPRYGHYMVRLLMSGIYNCALKQFSKNDIRNNNYWSNMTLVAVVI